MSAERLLLVRVGAEQFAFPIAEILEVTEASAVTPLAMVPAGLLGQAMHRDRLVPVLDAGVMLGGARDEAVAGARQEQAGDAPSAGVLLLLDVEGERVALQADDVVDMVVVERAQWRPTPGMASATSVLLDGVVDLGTGIAGVVAMDALRAAMRTRLMTEAR